MKTPKEILNDMQKEDFFLPIWNTIRKNHRYIKSYGLAENVNNNEMYLSIGRTYLDIPTYLKFDITFKAKYPLAYINLKTEIKTLKINPNTEVNYLPLGNTGICLVSFGTDKHMIY